MDEDPHYNVTEKVNLQDGSVLMLLFVLSLSALSYLLTNLSDHRNRSKSNSHLFVVDDLKLYEPNINHMKMKLLNTISQFSRDIGMNFGEPKYPFLTIKLAKILPFSEKLKNE